MKNKAQSAKAGLVSLLFIFLISGCGDKQLAPAEYVKWIESGEKGLKVSKKMADGTVELQFMPHRYMALQNLKGKSFTAREVDSVASSYGTMQYYKMSLNSSGIYQNLNEYEIRKRISMIAGDDTLSCQLFHIENTMGLRPGVSFLMGFESSGDAPVDKTLIFRSTDKTEQPVRLRISENSLKALPELAVKHNK